MPDRRQGRWYVTLGLFLGMGIALVVVSVIARDAQVKVNEQVRDTRVAEVAACYASARGRPRLIRILRSISGTLDEGGKAALTGLINDYERRTPLVRDCDELAVAYHLDPAEFPPPTPRGEEARP